MKKQTALIIDDEPDICELLEITLNRMQLDTDSAGTLEEARKKLHSRHFDLCLTDLRLPDGNGLDLLDYIQVHHPKLPVAVITAHGNMEAAIRALKSGAFDFISKPIDLANLRALVSSALKLSAAKPLSSLEQRFQLIGESAAIRELHKTINKLARSQAPVYIHGESGTGKELVARLIHEHGPRKNKPFVAVNCSAIPGELMESEFFGHKKGSFTGAATDKDGLFTAADGGTLFLDEIAELPLAMQVKLLRAIQERAIRPVGEQTEQQVDVRILSASHKDLDEQVEKNTFRQDLYYRINVIRIDVPPLRERPEDIMLLTRYFLEKISEKHRITSPLLDQSTETTLMHYAFPGNVRELENILERALTLCENNTINNDDLQLPKTRYALDTLTESDHDTLDDQLHQQERESILDALEQTRWNKTEAAKRLGMSFRQLRYRIKKLKIES